jgi:protocatechuate 3,4-dioxygenase beta subunit/peroxiredoxin
MPERLRAPLILCYLEGLTNEQAAQRLRVSVRTVRRRMADGRDRLTSQSSERGVAPDLSLLALNAGGDAMAANLPTTWLTTTVTGAVQISARGTAAGAASARALSMMEELMRATFKSKLLFSATLLMLAGFLAVGLLPVAKAQRSSGARPENGQGNLARPVFAKEAHGQAKPCEVTVIAKDTGKPLAHATLRYSINLLPVEATTDDRGRATLELDRESLGRGSLGIDVWAEGYVQQRYSFSNSDKRQQPIPEQLKVVLSPGTETFGGLVKDETGRPVVGATVMLWGYLAKKEESHELVYMVRSTTDDEGRWRNRSLRPMTFINLYISHPGFLSDDDFHARRVGEPNGPVVPSFADLKALSREDVMTRGVEIRGRVLDDGGKPIVGAIVGWVTNEHTFHDRVPKTTTDGDGRYRFRNARPGRVAIFVRAKAREPGLKQIDVVPGIDPVDFQLGAGKILSGRVVDNSGEPVADAFVNIDTWRRYRCLGVFLSTDADGRFSWPEAPSDDILLNASKSGYVAVIQQRTRADGGEVRLILSPSLQVSGTIKDAETGKRVENVVIESGAVDPDSGEVAWSQNPKVFAFSGQLQATFNAANVKAFKIRVGAGGYETVVSPEFRVADGNATFDVALRKEKNGNGLVLGPEGQPIGGATVFVLTRQSAFLRLREGKTAESGGGAGQLTATTEPNGSFSVPMIADQYVIVAAHAQYYGEAAKEQFEKTHTLRVAPWGRVEGTLNIGSKLAGGVKVALDSESSDRFPGIHVSSKDEKRTDAQGGFVFEKVVPGAVRISRPIGQGMDRDSWDLGRLFAVNPGETTQAPVGGFGRPVTGQLLAPAGTDQPEAFFRDYEIHLESNRAYFPYPLALIRAGQLSKWGSEWRDSAAGRAYLQDFVRRALRVEKDGSFRFDDVPEGVYQLHAHLRQAVEMKKTPEQRNLAHTFYQTFTIPHVAGGQTDEPLELGRCSMWIQNSPSVGAPAPEFKVTTLDGREVTLADYRGHYVLLDFGAPPSRQSRFQVGRLEKLAARFEKDDRLVILSFTVDLDTPETRAYIVEKGQRWHQAIIGPVSPENSIARSYDIGIGEGGRNPLPREYLIDPGGKLIAKDLANNKIEEAIAKALEKP